MQSPAAASAAASAASASAATASAAASADAPLSLACGLTLPNRIAKAAMSERLAAAERAPSEGLLRLYERWSRGGAGLLITGNVMVDPSAIGEDGNVVVEDERHLPGLRAWATAAHSGGARVLAQLNHPGRQTPRNLSRQPVAPSAVPMRGMFGAFAPPRALRVEEIEALIERFSRSAAVFAAAGFDGVQVHAAHGYLISQFLSPLTNLRDDEYGGDAARRRRFLCRIVEAIRAEVPAGFAVSVKLNSADFQHGGFSAEESVEVLRALETLGVDLVEISGGTYEASVMFGDAPPERASTVAREAFFLAYAEQARAQVALPLMVTGGFRSAAGIAAALAAGATDVVGLARPLCVEPDLPLALRSDQAAVARRVDLRGGGKSLETVVQGTWYQRQLDCMARGLEPDPGLSRLGAVFGYLAPRKPPAAVAVD